MKKILIKDMADIQKLVGNISESNLQKRNNGRILISGTTDRLNLWHLYQMSEYRLIFRTGHEINGN